MHPYTSQLQSPDIHIMVLLNAYTRCYYLN